MEPNFTWSEPLPLFANLTKNDQYIHHALAIEKSFDLIYRSLFYAGTKFSLYFVDGFAKDDLMVQILRHLSSLEPEDLHPNAITSLLVTELSYIELEATGNMEKILNAILSGPLVLLVDGCTEALIIDARTYPARNPDEPDIERVVRGARDGFTETLIFNTALTRRRLRDRSLRMEYMQIGARSKTDICISYLEDVADTQLVQHLKAKLEGIEIDGLPMAEKTLEEFLFKHNWNPFPLVRYTERPDVAAIHLLEGHILIYTDTSPSVMITPTTLFHHVQHAEEYRQKPIVGAYLRWIRFIGIFASVYLLPLWFLVALEPSLLPEAWRFIGPEKSGEVPLLLQFLLAEVGIDLLRMAAVHTPSPLATALGLVAAIMIGQVAVEVGLFTNEVILYVAAAVIGTFATPSYELGLANRLVRLTLLIAVGFFHLAGFIGGILFWFILLASMRSMHTPYLWPLLPFNGKALLDILVRSPMPEKEKRPRVIAKEDRSRM
ncbi:spore germination protein [Rubeoparvulum massiliense]|uniref:spore germination protein n=1 Tax=Rubeoparvulum massiliense TaxID=1631346 RepID=UPI00065E79D2|nr:spore germination protein [Rubeoparvulum massiliense]